jgi:hypothetical protein
MTVNFIFGKDRELEELCWSDGSTIEGGHGGFYNTPFSLLILRVT